VVLKQIIVALLNQAAEIDKVKTGGGVLKFLKLRFLKGYFEGCCFRACKKINFYRL
jgi:hypothetical protein